jgi:L-arabinose isomerase
MEDFGFKFSKGRQLIVGSHNETLSIAIRVIF